MKYLATLWEFLNRFLAGFILSRYWNWFISPTFNVAEMPYIVGVAVYFASLIFLKTKALTSKEIEEIPDTDLALVNHTYYSFWLFTILVAGAVFRIFI